ncbi:MAG: hypothetical protein KatS3mg114_0727 [Planctomycetaceae bacterium]|nr:MAG: hypothetical protein KatS3mg114_0727 [Planctomycetaceae bacterium]
MKVEAHLGQPPSPVPADDEAWEPEEAGDESDALLDAEAPQAPTVEVPITLETVLGLLAAFFIGLFVPLVGSLLWLGVMFARGWWDEIMLVGAGLLLLSWWLAIMLLKLASRASLGKNFLPGPRLPGQPPPPVVTLPLALAMAAQIPRWPVPWNVFVGGWWLAHFGAAAWIGHQSASLIIQRFDLGSLLTVVPLALALHFAFVFAANLYLVLALRLFFYHPRVCVLAWRYRMLVDSLLAVLLLLLRNK